MFGAEELSSHQPSRQVTNLPPNPSVKGDARKRASPTCVRPLRRTLSVMKQTTATLLGFLAASVLPATYLSVVFPLSGERDVQSVLLSAFVFYFFAAVATAIFGLPTYLVLKRFNLVTWWSAWAAERSRARLRSLH
jgi:hypothetical protein